MKRSVIWLPLLVAMMVVSSIAATRQEAIDKVDDAYNQSLDLASERDAMEAYYDTIISAIQDAQDQYDNHVALDPGYSNSAYEQALIDWTDQIETMKDDWEETLYGYAPENPTYYSYYDDGTSNNCQVWAIGAGMSVNSNVYATLTVAQSFVNSGIWYEQAYPTYDIGYIWTLAELYASNSMVDSGYLIWVCQGYSDDMYALEATIISEQSAEQAAYDDYLMNNGGGCPAP